MPPVPFRKTDCRNDSRPAIRQYLPVREFIARYAPDTDRHGHATWEEAFDVFAEEDVPALRALMGSVALHGFDQPVHVRTGRVLDGHRRVMTAWLLDRPVEYVVDDHRDSPRDTHGTTHRDAFTAARTA